MSEDIGNFVLNSYIASEEALDKLLKIIPYCHEHKNVWSPSLVTILLDTCSQLDSLCKYTAKQLPYVKKKQFNIKDYFIHFGPFLAPRWVVFWCEKPLQISPFEKWRKSPPLYETLSWWEAYNKIKHDRIKNKTEATFENTVNAMAGLFVTILWCNYCHNAVVHSSWFNPLDDVQVAYLKESEPYLKNYYLVAESKLFSYPFGCCKEKILQGDEWHGFGSPRFINWFKNYSQEKY